jgi:hypothetical protein
MLKKVSTVAIMQSEAFRDHGHEENWPTEALEELGFIVELLLILCTKQVVSATLLPLTAYLVNDHCDVHREVDQRIQCIEVQHDLQRQTRRHVITLILQPNGRATKSESAWQRQQTLIGIAHISTRGPSALVSHHPGGDSHFG